MSTRCTIIIPVEEEEALLQAASALTCINDPLIVEKVGRAEIASRSTGVEQVYYDIIFERGTEDPTQSTMLFQLGQSVAYIQAGIMRKD